MENYRQLIQSQAEALKKDIEDLTTGINFKEIELEDLKDKKSKAQSILRGIEKKLAGK